MKIGYARVSTTDQNPQLQLDALDAAGCDEIRTEHASGKDAKRPELIRLLGDLHKDDDKPWPPLDELQPGDTLVVWKLDRLGRSVVDLDNIVRKMAHYHIGFVSLTDGIDTSTNGGELSISVEMFIGVLAVMARFERALIRERIKKGVDAARKQGRVGGRKPKLTDDDLDLLVELWERDVPVVTLAAKWNVDKVTIYRAYKRAKARQSAT